ncbi:MAG: indolepyruvate oxidoreductase subunit beta family protein [Betaproteobacteria bacterium]|nr:indolepyruvate oxidoreductase subunit beta family protein [Betaproteobacteria bacterium]
MTAAPGRSLRIAILAMGGEGGGVLADWLVDMAEHAGWHAQTTSVPGVAQRTGATIYYVEILPDPEPGRLPVLALMPFPGDVDVVIASELMEAGRAVQRGLVTPDRTTFIASSHRVYSMTEKTAMGDGRVDAGKLLDACKASAKTWICGDFAEAAERAGSVVSSALLGALAGSKALPWPVEAFRDAIRRGGVGVDTSLAAFDAGLTLAAAPVAPAVGIPEGPKPGPRLQALAQRIAHGFPQEVRPTLEAGIVRLADYQDIDYAMEYLDRLAALAKQLSASNSLDPRLFETTARHLALWMTYEDTIRVADLKTRRSRFARVSREVRLRDDQLLDVSEFMHPRVEEVADTLPAGLGRWLLRTSWARSLTGRVFGRGRVVRTSSLRGYLQLYAVAALRPMRRRTLRFVEETRRIDAWLTRIAEVAARDLDLAIALAECQRLVKGYGDTHARGLANFETVMSAAHRLQGRPGAGAAVRELLEAALADERGDKLGEAKARLAA